MVRDIDDNKQFNMDTVMNMIYTDVLAALPGDSGPRGEEDEEEDLDDEFEAAAADDDEDDETTLIEEESRGRNMAVEDELSFLKADNEMSIEQLQTMYGDNEEWRLRSAQPRR